MDCLEDRDGDFARQGFFEKGDGPDIVGVEEEG
jgi:hypothetical protein